MKISHINIAIKFLKELGVKKTVGCVIAGLGICYAYSKIKSNCKIKEQTNNAKNKCEEIKTASLCNMTEREQDHKFRIDEEREKTAQKKEIINTQKEAEIEKMKMRNQLSMERDAAKANSIFVEANPKEKIMSYHDVVQNGEIGKSTEKAIGFSWLREGYDTGLVGPTDCGKSTFVMQVAIAIAKGKCNINLTHDWHNIPPIHVLLFSLEQSNREIYTYYGSVIDNLPTLDIYADPQIMPTQIIAIIKEKINSINSKGMVVFIDNYTKLEEIAGVKAMKLFCKELDQLRNQSIKAGKPITPFKVYHAKPNWDSTKPLTPESVRGDKKNVYFTNNFLYFTYCKHGSDKRMLGYMKFKHGNKEDISILEYAGTKVDQFRYIGKGSKKDLGVPVVEGSSNNGKQGPGRKSEHSLNDIVILYNMVQNKECTYAEIEKVYGIKKSTIKKRIQRNCKQS